MGIFLNSGNERFQKSISSELYVHKTGFIVYTNHVLGTEQSFVCVNRPRRFHKSMAAGILAAYYGRECQSKELFRGLSIEKQASFLTHLNQYNVISINM